MQIGLIGATGNIGARIISEGVSRGVPLHCIQPLTQEPDTEHVVWRRADVLGPERLRAELAGLDVLVSAFGPGSAARICEDATAQSIRSPELFAQPQGRS